MLVILKYSYLGNITQKKLFVLSLFLFNLGQQILTFTAETAESIKTLTLQGRIANTLSSIFTAHARTRIMEVDHHRHMNNSTLFHYVFRKTLPSCVIQFTSFVQ